MRWEAYLRTFTKVLAAYPAEQPLTKFLPEYFKKHKEMGSGDRRWTSRLLYTYFRLGKACNHLPQEQRLFLAEFLCSKEENPFLAHFRPDLAEQWALPLADKISLLEKNEGFVLAEVFPFTAHLSAGVDTQAFLEPFFVQPDLFIRIHPGKEAFLKAKLTAEAIPYQELTAQTLSFANGTKLNHLLEEGLFEVQDYSSQQTADYFEPKQYEYWWDACAASGGKSILLNQLAPDLKLLVTDLRESVLNNLDERFKANGIRNYQRKVLDLLQNPDAILHHYEFDGIILDAPCTGSGTWGRTPELLSQFADYRIADFKRLQQSIAKNVVKYLKPGKPLIYITCSVFKEENEAMVDYLVNQFGLKLEKQSLFAGYGHKADTLFVARLVREV